MGPRNAIEQIKSALFEDVQDRVKSLEERLRSVMDHEMHVHQTIDRNTHSQCASIKALISEQEDVRELVEELANRLDRSQAHFLPIFGLFWGLQCCSVL